MFSCSKNYEKELELKDREIAQLKKENMLNSDSVNAITNQNNTNILKELSSNFLTEIKPSSPLQKLKNIYGEPKKIFSSNNTTFYYYELQNVYLLIETVDEKSISTISIQSKGKEPYIKIGNSCPIDFYNGEKLFLGKTKFKDLYDKSGQIEISRDRCTQLGFIVDYGGNPCSYNNYIYGSIIDYTKFEINQDELINDNLYFESSYGKISLKKFENQIIDYVVISNDDKSLKNNHAYGQGVHCDYINQN